MALTDRLSQRILRGRNENISESVIKAEDSQSAWDKGLSIRGKEGVKMKRWMVPLGLVLVIGLGSYAVFAQHEPTTDQPQQGMVGNMGCTMTTLAATTDGGVVVATGGKLVKYDATLKKVAEVALDVGEDATGQTMQGCPMMNMMK